MIKLIWNYLYYRKSNSKPKAIKSAWREQLQITIEGDKSSRLGEEDTSAELVDTCLNRQLNNQELFLAWNQLSNPEQHVAALICLGYTNIRIAALMGIELNMVVSYLDSILQKFSVKDAIELQSMLAVWDFRAWGRQIDDI